MSEANSTSDDSPRPVTTRRTFLKAAAAAAVGGAIGAYGGYEEVKKGDGSAQDTSPAGQAMKIVRTAGIGAVALGGLVAVSDVKQSMVNGALNEMKSDGSPSRS